MAQLGKREFLLLGVTAGAIIALALMIPLAIVFDDSREIVVQPPPGASAPTTIAPGISTTTTTTAPGGTGTEPVVLTLQAPSPVIAAINKAGCSGCHTIPGVPGAEGKVGPNLATIGADAASRKPPLSAEEYIRESILDPAAFIAPACPNGLCPQGVMLPTFAEILTPAEVDTIVAFLAVLGTDREGTVFGEPPAPVALSADLPLESVLDPFQPYPGEAPPAAQIALGRYLFFDGRLSGNNAVSCSTCHQPALAFTDGQALSDGYPSTALFRNTPTVLNAVFADPLYWDGRMDGDDLATLVRDHLTEAHFMAMDGRLMVERLKQVPGYRELFVEVYDGEISFGRVLNAVAAYVRSLNSTATAYDAFAAGDSAALSVTEQAGLGLFEGAAGCSACHAGPLFTDYDFYNTGVGTDPAIFADPELHVTFRRFFRTLGVPDYRNLFEDVGLFALTFDAADRAKFRTPSLREVARTAPYMHDGSLDTLEDVVRFYNEGGGPTATAGLEPLSLADEQIRQLVAFLETLSSDPVDVIPPELPNYDVVPLGGG